MSKEPEQHDANLYDWYKWHDDEEVERTSHAMSRVKADSEEFVEEAWRKYEKRYERSAKRDRRRKKLDVKIEANEAAFGNLAQTPHAGSLVANRNSSCDRSMAQSNLGHGSQRKFDLWGVFASKISYECYYTEIQTGK